MVSLCREGVLGGGIVADDEGLVYQTGKTTVSPRLKRIEMKYDNIQSYSRSRVFCFPLVSITMKDGECYKFIVFSPSAFCSLLDSRVKA
jgi:hypothetical protein